MRFREGFSKKVTIKLSSVVKGLNRRTFKQIEQHIAKAL